MDYQSHVSQAWAAVAAAKDTLRKIHRDGSGELPDQVRLAQVQRSILRALQQAQMAQLERPEENKEAG